MWTVFESLVNTEGFQTNTQENSLETWFESLVNTEGFQTIWLLKRLKDRFESLVNTEGFQTKNLANNTNITCLRVLLIQKDFKPDEGLGTIGKNHIQSSSNSSSQNCSFSLL